MHHKLIRIKQHTRRRKKKKRVSQGFENTWSTRLDHVWTQIFKKNVYKEEPWWKFDIMNKIKGYSERMLHVTTWMVKIQPLDAKVENQPTDIIFYWKLKKLQLYDVNNLYFDQLQFFKTGMVYMAPWIIHSKKFQVQLRNEKYLV